MKEKITVATSFIIGVVVVVFEMFLDVDIPANVTILFGIILFGLLTINLMFIFNFYMTISGKVDKFFINRTVKKYPCVMKEFQEFVSEFFDVMMNPDKTHSLYSITTETCDNLSNDGKYVEIFQSDVDGHMSNYKKRNLSHLRHRSTEKFS